MSDKHMNRSRARAQRLRAQRRKRMLTLGGIGLAGAVALAVVILLLTKLGKDPARPAAQPVEAATAAPEPTEAPASTPESTVQPTVESTPEATPEPTRTPQPTPEGRPDVVSFYQNKDGVRARMGDSFTAPWTRGKDIGSFEVVASDADRLEGSYFGEIFGKAWKGFPAAGQCKVGYALRYTLDDGQEIRYTMLSPQHIQHTEYIECWLYDDYHQKPHQFYSHLKKAGKNTLITSIKLTCGSQIKHVKDIWLMAFIASSADEFDADRNYIGDTYCTLHILKK